MLCAKTYRTEHQLIIDNLQHQCLNYFSKLQNFRRISNSTKASKLTIKSTKFVRISYRMKTLGALQLYYHIIHSLKHNNKRVNLLKL